MSLLRKLTLGYSVLIFIPAAIAGYYYYQRTETNLEEEIRKSSTQTLLQVKDNISFKIAAAQSIIDKVAYTSELKYFLSKDFQMTPEAYANYLDLIKPLIAQAARLNQINVYRLSIYTNNESIPEGWGMFFSDKRIIDQDWYKEFIADGKKIQTWLYPHKDMVFSINSSRNSNKVFTLVKKIYSANGSYLGAATLDILDTEVFSSLKNVDTGFETIYSTENSGKVLYTSRSIDSVAEALVLKEYKKGATGSFNCKNILYLYDSVIPLDIGIIIKIPLDGMLANARAAGRNIVLAMLAGFILLILFTYLMVKVIFAKLKNIVKVMNNVARGDFNMRIRQEGKDEVGQLADDFNILIEKINVLIQDNIRRETAQKDAQLSALQYQINPHFIYNMIDVFRMKMELAGDFETAEAITDFGKMFRYNISTHSKYATLKDEVDNVKKYINLQKLRFGDKINIAVNLPEEAENFLVIKFILQPIVENSIRHGFSNNKPSLDIEVDFELRDSHAVITVTDNGTGITAAHVEKLNDMLEYSMDELVREHKDGGIGLANINKRMKLFYGHEYFTRMESIEGEFTRTILRFPYNTGG